MEGSCSADPHVGVATSFRYEDDRVSLHQYTIVEKEKFKEICNWLQCFSP